LFALSDQEIEEQIKALMKDGRNGGFDVEQLCEHGRNVRSVLQGQDQRFFKVLDTARLDNGGVIAGLECCRHSSFKDIISFVPAAGASSRWIAPLESLIFALQSKDFSSILREINVLIADESIRNCPLPTSLKGLIDSVKKDGKIPDQISTDSILADIDAPKALFPSVLEGHSFLEMKTREVSSIDGVGGQVFVCPNGHTELFRRKLEEIEGVDCRTGISFFEQGAALSTIRWKDDGSICVNQSGEIASVSAGHGSLLRLLPKVKDLYPNVKSVWIRNIDNVVGTSQKVVDATKNFLFTHQTILDVVVEMRQRLSDGDIEGASDISGDLILKLGMHGRDKRSIDPIQYLVERIFHAPLKVGASPDDILKILNRKVVTMGQVSNTNQDVGGTPAFCEVYGVKQKLCLEVPHASFKDRKDFLENPQLATHFNPVFVAAEIPSKDDLSIWNDHPFWLVAKKTYRGQDVWYQESILYEMLGSSAFCNVTFVEVPRSLFNPHKSLTDASGRRLSNWS
jgi:hypothetical protein